MTNLKSVGEYLEQLLKDTLLEGAKTSIRDMVSQWLFKLLPGLAGKFFSPWIVTALGYGLYYLFKALIMWRGLDKIDRDLREKDHDYKKSVETLEAFLETGKDENGKLDLDRINLERLETLRREIEERAAALIRFNTVVRR